MTAQAAPGSVELTLEVSHKVKGYVRRLAPLELVRGVPAEFTVVFTNASSWTSPACEVRVEFTEHGMAMSGSQVSWYLRDTIKVPGVRKGRHFSCEFAYTPLLEGTCVVSFVVQSKDDQAAASQNVRLSGFRTTTDQKVDFYFHAVSRQQLELEKRLDRLLQQTKREA